ncbi:MAG: NYN domain-containing protein [Zoogloeaceae bacterium]|nr:NYN domain-containing protein [Zoogloeaceae bacterium]
MAAPSETTSMALFCDFENIALGVRDAKYEKFDIKPVLERLLAKGSIVVKKAYCDWDRYKSFKAVMHEANFELIEIPHVRQSGKNSADIRMVVDALDLCYTKAHVDTFVIISGDSDFSPLVSKLRENAKQVIGVGVKQSTSDLLIANCDEFIFYDDLVRERESKRTAARRESKESAARRSPEEEKARRDEIEARKTKAIELAVDTFEDMIAVRGDVERIWASVLKEAIKRRNPGFNESYYGYKAFGTLLEDAAARGLIGFGRDEKSGAFVTRVTTRPVVAATITEAGPSAPKQGEAPEPVPQDVPAAAKPSPRRRGRTGRKAGEGKSDASVALEPVVAPAELVQETTAELVQETTAELVQETTAEQAVPEGGKTKSKTAARPRRSPRKKAEAPVSE